MNEKHNFLSEILLRQLMPSFKMIALAIERCPKAIWAQRNIDPPIWQQVYHVLYTLDYWFSESKEKFVSPDFNDEVSSVLGEDSKGFIVQEDIILYLNFVEEKAAKFISNLAETEITAPSKHYQKWTNLDDILEQVRHLQHHLGYLNRVLLKCKLTPVEWECYDQ